MQHNASGAGARRRQSLRIVFAGGGTGGHLFPAIAIAQAFLSRDPACEICFVSTGNAFERTTLARAGFRLASIRSEGLKGRGLWRQLRALAKIPVGVFQSIRLLGRFRPDLVVGVCSYAAGPVVIGAWVARLPIVLHEQNVLPGITNRLLSRFADRVYVSFPSTSGHLASRHVRVTGNPVRQEILNAGGGKKAGPGFTVLVVGGSQGAHSINLAMADAIGRLEKPDDWFFIHQTGVADMDVMAQAYKNAGFAADVRAFFEDMADQYGKADLVVCRAGATTVAEVTALGKASVLIPYPHAADNHQARNALWLTDAGAAETLLESDLNGERLSRMIVHFAAHPGALAQMGRRAKRFAHPDAAMAIVTDCCALLAKTANRPNRQHAAG